MLIIERMGLLNLIFTEMWKIHGVYDPGKAGEGLQTNNENQETGTNSMVLERSEHYLQSEEWTGFGIC